MFSMITESVPKSSVTVDTAFRKDLTLQGCTTLPTRAFTHTCQPTLNANVIAFSLESRQRVVDHDLYLTFVQTMSHALRIVPP
jgi:hypothetical protein